LPETGIVFISLNPRIARWSQNESCREVNHRIEEFARETPRVKLLDVYALTIHQDGSPRTELFAPDKLHLNAEGYKLLAEQVRTVLPKPDKDQ
jgi:lysophospholipase L1-like esterase